MSSHSLQMTTDCQCCFCLLLGFHNNTTVLSPGLGLDSWPPSSLPIGPSLSFLWPVSSQLSASNVNTDWRQSKSWAQYCAIVENGNVAKSLNFKGSISVYLGLGPRRDFLSRIILRLRSRVRLRQPGRAMETSRHSGSGADLKWMVRDCEEVKMLKSVQLCNYVESWGQRFRQVSGGLWSWHLVSGEGAMMWTEAFLCITMIMMTIILVNLKSRRIGQWHETPSLYLIWH